MGVSASPSGSTGDLAEFEVGELGFGHPDPVAEQQDLEVDVAAQRVDQVVATDGQGVAVR
jgi:hypothetical protein